MKILKFNEFHKIILKHIKILDSEFRISQQQICVSLIEFYDFHDFHDSDMEFYYFNEFHDSLKKLKDFISFVII